MVSKVTTTARSILFLIPPGFESPFQVRLGMEVNNPNLQSKGDFTINNCQSIAHAVEKALVLMNSLGLTIATDFTLVYPAFQGRNDEQEANIINNAWMIKDAADEQGWLFSRTLPNPIF